MVDEQWTLEQVEQYLIDMAGGMQPIDFYLTWVYPQRKRTPYSVETFNQAWDNVLERGALKVERGYVKRPDVG